MVCRHIGIRVFPGATVQQTTDLHHFHFHLHANEHELPLPNGYLARIAGDKAFYLRNSLSEMALDHR